MFACRKYLFNDGKSSGGIYNTRDNKKAPGTSGYQGMIICPFLFNIISLPGNALSLSQFELSYLFKIECISWSRKYSFTASMALSLLPYCVPRRGISVL